MPMLPTLPVQAQVANDVLAAAKAVQLSGGGGKSGESGEGGLTEEEMKRLEMRKALAKRIKDDILLA